MNLSTFLLILILSHTAFAKRLVCTATINSSEEKEVFKKNLNPNDFDFIELTELKNDSSSNGESWFNKACEANIQCDVLIISGHFGGTFFSEKNKDTYLSSGLMEKQSCRKTCDGLLRNPKEVFLFGCNTLATKDADHRTPAQYLEVLLRDGLSRSEAEQIVQARYGGLGSSFKDRMRRIFSNVPVIHGFDSVGPSGKNVKPLLNKYFKNDVSYKERLDLIEAQKLVGLIEASNKKISEINGKMTSALKSTSYTFCSGLSDSDSTSGLREKICQLHDLNKSQNEKLAIIEEMLLSSDQRVYLPSITDFFSNSVDPDKTSVAFLRLQKNEKIKSDLEKINSELLKSSPSMYAELLQMRYNLGFVSESEYNIGLKSFMQSQLKKFNVETIDTLCSMSRNNAKLPDVSASDFPKSALKNPLLPHLMNCLKTKDITITQSILKLADEPGNKFGILYSLGDLPGMDQEIYQLAKKNLNTNDKDQFFIANRLIILKSNDPKEQVEAIRKSLSATDYGNYVITDAIVKAKIKDVGLASEVLNQLIENKTVDSTLFTISQELTPDNSAEQWTKLVQYAEKSEMITNNLINNLTDKSISNPAITTWATQHLIKDEPVSGFNFMRYLSNVSLDTHTQKQLYTELEKNPSSQNARYYRGLLKKQKRTDLTQKEDSLLRGPARIIVCKKTSETNTSCQEEIQ